MGVDSDTATRWEYEDRLRNYQALAQPVWEPDWLRPLKLYTAGPMSWIPRFNYPAFMALADCLRARGWTVVSPAELDSPEMQAKCEASEDGNPADLGGEETWGDLLSRDVKIIADEVDGVVLLPGWEDSKGARLEAFVARHVGKPVFYWLGGTYNGDQGLHEKVCNCEEAGLFYGTGLLELDDAELDHVLTAADTLTLMKMERDAREEPTWLAEITSGYRLKPAEKVVTSANGGSRIVWDFNEGGFDDPLPAGMFDSPATAAKYGYEADGETRKVDPDTGGEKGSKLARFDLVPATPLWHLAEHYGKGAEKYDDRNWERGYAWSLCYAAMQRHLLLWWDGEDLDAETGSNHLTAAAWHCFALLEFTNTHPEKDDRP